MRADVFLVDAGLAATRSQAQRLIAAGVRIRAFAHAPWVSVAKNGDDIPKGAEVELLNADEAKLLNAQEGTPVFYKASHERDETDGFVEYCKSVILPTKYRFADNGEADDVATKVGVEWLMQ